MESGSVDEPSDDSTNNTYQQQSIMQFNRILHYTAFTVLFGLALSAPSLHAQGTDTGTEHEGMEESTTIGGYGEIGYIEPEGTARGTVDVPRFIIFLEHYFSPDISFFSELEVEHTKVEGNEEGGEVALEQAYLQYNLGEQTSLRAGLVLLPIGIINEFHEPPTFNGFQRPRFDRSVIPTTWREIGLGVVGRVPAVEGLQYRAYVTNGLDAEGFSPMNGIRGGRLEGAEAPLQNLAFSGRLEYLNGGLKTGGSVYYGGSSGGNPELGSGLFDAPVFLYSFDAQFNVENLYLRGIVTGISLDEKINDVLHRSQQFDSISGGIVTRYVDPIGTMIGGGYIEAAYDVAKLISPTTTKQLLPFVRYEKFNTMADVPTGTTADPSTDRSYIVAGLTFKPTYNTVFKFDWTMADDATDNKVPGELALGVGYNF